MGALVTFYVFAGVMLASAVAVIWARTPVYSLLALLVAMFCVAALFVLLNAVFLAALQILIYAGAVLVLFLFVIMLLSSDQQTITRTRQFAGRWLALGLAGWFVMQLGWVLGAGWLTAPLPATTPHPTGTIAAVGRALFREYLLPFELTSLLILAAIVGAVALAQRKSE